MSGFPPDDPYWSTQHMSGQPVHNYYDTDTEYTNLQSQQIDFQSFGDQSQDENSYYAQSFSQPEDHFKMGYSQMQYAEMLTPEYASTNTEFENEPPLLEELEIYPDRILEKTLTVLNPFRKHGLADDAEFLTKDSDLAGPIVFCLMLATALFLSGNSTPFSYIYGLSVISCILMYFLLTLMTHENVYNLTATASLLGYCLLPIVVLAITGIFLSLHNVLGMFSALVAVFWSSLSASRLFVGMSGDKEQRPLIAYPCALVYSIFALLLVF